MPQPSADWIERSPTPAVLEGPFTAHQYGVHVGDGVSEDDLKRYGFVAGYDREWEQKGTQDYLVERVFEFVAADGAKYWYNDLTLDSKTTKYFKRDIPALTTPNSSGVELDWADGSHSDRIFFAKGSFFFEVYMDSDANDLAPTALAIAQNEYDLAPSSVDASHRTATVSTAAERIIGFAVIGLVLLVTTVVFVLLLSQASRRRPSAVGASAVRMSPDGQYWWDGVQWRRTATDPPPPPTLIR